MSTSVLYTRCPVPTASGIAIDTGLLQQRLSRAGVDAGPLQSTAYPEAHFDHKAPSLFREGGNVPALWARSNGAPTKLLAVTWIPEFQMILARKDSGFRTADDLAGRRLILPSHGGERVDFFRAMALRAFDSVLRSTGRTLGDATLVPYPSRLPQVSDVGADGFYASSLEALRRGDGDFVYVKGAPGADVVRRNEFTAVVDFSEFGSPAFHVNNGTPRTLTVSENLLEANRDVVVQYVAALVHAAQWASDNEGGTAAIVARETGSSLDGVRLGYGKELHRNLEPNLDPTLLNHLENQQTWLLDQGLLTRHFDIDTWIDTTILRDALDTSVRTKR